MKVNIYFDKLDEKSQGLAGMTGIYFRYYDAQNYYVLKFNVPGKDQIELYKKVSGEESLIGITYYLAKKGDSVKFRVWYRYFFVIHYKTIKIYRQIVKLYKLGKNKIIRKSI
jgi:hypothetical protein